MDVGKYNKDSKLFEKLIKEMYENYKPVTLSAEFNYLIQENTLNFLIRLARYKFIARLIKKTDVVLEVGCGSGIGTIFLGQHAKNVLGIDVKDFELDQARDVNKRKNVTFEMIDFFDLNPAKKFDIIVCVDVIEHMPVEDGKQFIKKMSQLLDPNGMAFVGTPSIYSYEFQCPESKASHVKCYDQAELAQVFEPYFGRTLAFSMNDEMVHTGFPKLAWYYFIVAFCPKNARGETLRK